MKLVISIKLNSVSSGCQTDFDWLVHGDIELRVFKLDTWIQQNKLINQN